MHTQQTTKSYMMSNIINNQEILDRFNSAIEELLHQLQILGLHTVIKGLANLSGNQSKLSEIIDNLINDVEYLSGEQNSVNFDSYIQSLLSKFSINEQCIIVAHFNLNGGKYLLEDMEFMVYEYFYQTVKERLMN